MRKFKIGRTDWKRASNDELATQHKEVINLWKKGWRKISSIKMKLAVQQHVLYIILSIDKFNTSHFLSLKGGTVKHSAWPTSQNQYFDVLSLKYWFWKVDQTKKIFSIPPSHIIYLYAWLVFLILSFNHKIFTMRLDKNSMFSTRMFFRVFHFSLYKMIHYQIGEQSFRYLVL